MGEFGLVASLVGKFLLKLIISSPAAKLKKNKKQNKKQTQLHYHLEVWLHMLFSGLCVLA